VKSELDRYRTDRGHDPNVEVVARSAARICESEGVEAIVAGRDGESTARLRTIGNDGSILEDEAAALGSGAEMALARLDEAEFAEDIDGVADQIREIMAGIAERDTETGTDVDLVTIASR
jgi:proteasome beta subunit